MAEAVTKQQTMDLLAAAAYLETDGASMPAAEAERIAATLRALASQPSAPRAEAVEALHEFDHALSTWAKAYPLSVFPEPDFDEVKRLLGGNLLTRVSAANMRHVVTKLDELFAPVRVAAIAQGADEGERNG